MKKLIAILSVVLFANQASATGCVTDTLTENSNGEMLQTRIKMIKYTMYKVLTDVYSVIKSNVALLITALFVGIVVSIIAQLFILSAKNLDEIFYNNSETFFIFKLFNYHNKLFFI